MYILVHRPGHEVHMIAKPKLFYGWIVLAVALITMVLGYTVRNSFSVFYPAIVEEFGWGRGSTALMFSFTILVYGFVAPVAGGLVDRFGPRLVLPVGACIMGGGLALCSLARTQWHFYLLYGVIVAIGLSMAGWTPLSAMISNWFVRKRGLAFGIMSAGFGASMLSAPVAQLLIISLGWQIAYVIIGLISTAIIVPLCAYFVRRSPKEKGLLPDGMLKTSHESQTLDELVGPATLEGKWTSTTWTLTRALKTYRLWLLFFIAFCLLGLTEQAVIAHLVYFFRDAGYEPMQAATFFSVFGAMYIVGKLGSSLSDFWGREKVFLASCLISAGVIPLLFFLDDTSQLWVPLLFATCFGLGLGPTAPLFLSTVADLFQGRYFGSIQGFIMIGFSLGGAVSPWLAGFLYDKNGDYFATFLMLLGSLVASAVLMWVIAPRKIRPVIG